MKSILFYFLIVFSFKASFSFPITDSLKIKNEEKANPYKQLIERSNSDTARIRLIKNFVTEFQTQDAELTSDYIQKGISIAKKLNNRNYEAIFYILHGNIKSNNADYENGLVYTFKALEIAEELKNDSLIAACFNSIGKNYKMLGQFDLSIQYSGKALRLCENIGDSLCMASSYNYLGNAWFKKNDRIKAKDNYLRCLNISERQNFIKLTSAASNNLANVYKDEKNFEKALVYYQKALSIAENSTDGHGIAFYHNNIGSLYNQKGENQMALKYQLKALETAEKIKESVLLVNTYSQISKTYADLGNFENAYRYTQKYAEIVQNVFNENSSRQINEIQAKYETEKKQKEIELLKKDKEREKIIKYGLAGGLFLLCLLAISLYNRYRIKHSANKNLTKAYEIIEEKNKDIMDSILYAKRIQEAILPPDTFLHSSLPEHFVLYKPKDIVSGDFYWLEKQEDTILFAAVDCTGHGVPGAFMSIVGYNLLNQVVNEQQKKKPAEILNAMNKGLTYTLRQTQEQSAVKDGMDIALCSLNHQTKLLQFAGANNPLWIIRDKELIEIKGNKFPIGIFLGEQLNEFTNHEIQLQDGDLLYVFTDGFADQFGGAKGKKFKYKQLKETLLAIFDKPLQTQKELLNHTFNEWKGNLEQVDDVCIIGIRI